MEGNRKKSEVYEHAVNAHAREPEILVVREKLSLFPPVGTDFEVSVSRRRCRSRVVARTCQCAGPDSPHEHYYLDLTELARLLDWGTFSRVRIRRLASGGYSLATIK